jgi:methionyl aminopeptidase
VITIKTKEEIELMRKSGRLAAETLNHLEKLLKPGMSTLEVNNICHDYILSHGAIPAPLNYKGFPKSVCTSINQVVCHGIPSDKVKIKEGDILNVDVTTILNGYYGDTNKTFLIGNVKPEIVKLVQVTKECLDYAIAEVKPGARLGDIGAAIQEHAEKNGYSVVRDFCGHGIGRNFHEDPQILHFGKRGTGMVIKEGMTFTIEPMINLGTYRCRVLDDGWTAVTLDGKHSAQFEHTLAVTKDGSEILTL